MKKVKLTFFILFCSVFLLVDTIICRKPKTPTAKFLELVGGLSSVTGGPGSGIQMTTNTGMDVQKEEPL